MPTASRDMVAMLRVTNPATADSTCRTVFEVTNPASTMGMSFCPSSTDTSFKAFFAMSSRAAAEELALLNSSMMLVPSS